MKDKSYRLIDTSTSLLNDPLTAYFTQYQPMLRVQNISFNDLLDNKMRMVETIHIGISYDLYSAVASLLPFTDTQWADLLGISTKSLTRYKTEDAHVFKSLQSEKILEVAEVMLKGHEVLESASSFDKWVMSPSVALGGKSPYQLMSSSYGKELVMDELNRIEYGIFA
jgi:putative toxin-antitoxin system antitoxin component (TIGR02293 family)